MTEPDTAAFTGLVDLAAQTIGGRALAASDDFFAAMDNLIKPGPAIFVEGKFSERGKWMDGWESRRRRSSGHDWCVLALGAEGWLHGFDVDTRHFVGNSPQFVSIDALRAPFDTSAERLAQMPWREVLTPSSVRPGAQNLFVATPADAVSHVRLNIYPDGGVARLRVYGRVWPDAAPVDLDDVTQSHVAPGSVDLAALTRGGMALACSDSFFGPMNNLLLPGRAENMGGGWETRRRRGPGHDWIIIRLGMRGTVSSIEVDTNYFKGNYPDRCSLEAIDAPGARLTDLAAGARWSTLLPEAKLEPDGRQFFTLAKMQASLAVTHARFNIFPDGGVSRLRLWGSPR